MHKRLLYKIIKLFNFNKSYVLIGFLKDKTCILVTHQMQFLADMDQIVVMDNVNIKILIIITYTVN